PRTRSGSRRRVRSWAPCGASDVQRGRRRLGVAGKGTGEPTERHRPSQVSARSALLRVDAAPLKLDAWPDARPILGEEAWPQFGIFFDANRGADRRDRLCSPERLDAAGAVLVDRHQV